MAKIRDDYIIVEEHSDYDLQQTIRKYISQGYHPLGGVAVVWPGGMSDIRYVQAVVSIDYLRRQQQALKPPPHQNVLLEE